MRYLIFCSLTLCVNLLANEHEIATLEDVYTPRYCKQLEFAYGENMLSEGAHEATESMFREIPIENKRALDIGSGLGGMSFYLAEKHQMNITGLDVNRWLVNESRKRTPEALKDRVNFVLSSSNECLPFPDESFDIIYSKGTLLHIEKKEGLFRECHRLLRKGGVLVIVDWFTGDDKKWGKNMQQIIEAENLPIYPESESSYTDLLTKCGFIIQSTHDESSRYQKYNKDLLEKIKCHIPDNSIFNEAELKMHIEDFEAEISAVEIKELIVLRFIAKK